MSDDNDNTERLILSNLIYNEEFAKKVAPFLRTSYFTELPTKTIFELIKEFVGKYNSFPTKEALKIDLGKQKGLNEEEFKQTQKMVASLQIDAATKLDYLINTTEEWCQERAVYLALMKSIKIMENKDNKDKKQKLTKGAIPQLLTDALGISFDNHIGHDFLEDADERYEYYHQKTKKIPFDLEYLNKITEGGLDEGTLTVILAGPNVGKSFVMCHCAASHLAMGYNVLYITLEMAEMKVAKRVEANVIDVAIDEIKYLSKDTFKSRIARLKAKTSGKLIVKQYPMTTAGVTHFRALLNELKLKKNFVPDVIYIDYLNVCISSRYDVNAGLYTYVKGIAEELRGLAVEQSVPIVTATQVNRQGFNSSDIGMENTSESWGLPATADLMIALIKTEELEGLNQYLIKQIKNRDYDVSVHKRFVIGYDRKKMRLFDVEEKAQRDILDGPEVIDKSKTIKKKSFKKEKFANFL